VNEAKVPIPTAEVQVSRMEERCRYSPWNLACDAHHPHAGTLHLTSKEQWIQMTSKKSSPSTVLQTDVSMFL
jgi:hypothetical protein